MSEPTEFKKQISLGNIIQIGVMLVGGALAFAALDARTANNTEKIAGLSQSAEALEGRVRLLETNLARADERFASIINLLARIDARLERIERSAP